MVEYHHTQVGTFLRSALAASALVASAITLVVARNEPTSVLIPAVAATILVVVLLLFHSLTVTVSRDTVALKFGVGLIRKRFAVSDIESAETVQNRWYYGWGVRLTPHGWLFNVSGFDAVELKLKNGRKYRIGTDEPTQLCHAIHSALCRSGDR